MKELTENEMLKEFKKFESCVLNEKCYISSDFQNINIYKDDIEKILKIVNSRENKTFIFFQKDFLNNGVFDKEKLKLELMEHGMNKNNADDFIKHLNKTKLSFIIDRPIGNNRHNFIYIQNITSDFELYFTIIHELCHSLQFFYNKELYYIDINYIDDNNTIKTINIRETHADLFASLYLINTIKQNQNESKIENFIEEVLYYTSSRFHNEDPSYFSFPILYDLYHNNKLSLTSNNFIKIDGKINIEILFNFVSEISFSYYVKQYQIKQNQNTITNIDKLKADIKFLKTFKTEKLKQKDCSLVEAIQDIFYSLIIDLNKIKSIKKHLNLCLKKEDYAKLKYSLDKIDEYQDKCQKQKRIV